MSRAGHSPASFSEFQCHLFPGGGVVVAAVLRLAPPLLCPDGEPLSARAGKDEVWSSASRNRGGSAAHSQHLRQEVLGSCLQSASSLIVSTLRAQEGSS